MNELSLKIGEEQQITLGNYVVSFHFNPFAREWLFDMYGMDNEPVIINCALRPNTYPLYTIDTKFDYPRICMFDKEPDSKEELNPLLDFGDRLGVFEITGA